MLYVTLFAIAVIGTIAHAMVADAPRLVTIMDVASAYGLLGAMAVWVRLNRVQLSDEPDAGRMSRRSVAHPGRMKDALDTAWRVMREQGLEALAVVDTRLRVVGVLSEDDLLARCIPRRPLPWWDLIDDLALSPTPPCPPATDAELVAMTCRLDAEAWVPRHLVRVAAST